jgi:hypothetical protein
MLGPVVLVKEVALALEPLEGVFDHARCGIFGLNNSFLDVGVVRGGGIVVSDRCRLAVLPPGPPSAPGGGIGHVPPILARLEGVSILLLTDELPQSV